MKTQESAFSADPPKRRTKNKISSKYLLFVAFLSGFTIMAVEIAASRLLTPYFGSSLFVWTNIIGLIMVFLSLGYYFGGRLADRNPDEYLILKIISVAASFIFFIPFITGPITSIVSFNFLIAKYASLVIIIGSFLTTLLLFIIPITLLGAVSPFMIKILIYREKRQEGTKSGLVFAYSTIGSIFGTFLSSLVSIPILGTNSTIFAAGAILLIFTLPLVLKKKWVIVPVILLIILTFIWSFFDKSRVYGKTIFKDESVYQNIKIVEEDETYYLKLGADNAYSSLYKENLTISDGYFDYFSIAPYIDYTDKQKEILILGLAGGTMVHQYNNLLGDEFDFQIDGVEIDKKLTDIVQDKFNLEYDNLNIYNTDGRIFLRQNKKKYDIIVIDAFSKQLYIPAHLVTREFFQGLPSHLSDNGALAVNVVALSSDSKLLKAITNTLASEFENVYVASSQYSYNFFVLASDNEIDFSKITKNISNPSLKNLSLSIESSVNKIDFNPDELILYDDKAPLEYLTDRMAFEYLKSRNR
ncbi:MAG: fused MFS/spermidine synthase [Parcubacteria group bacterium]|nr:fused MFS/spermidine synthase [Parcubacteria group bacterium]